MMNSQAPSRFQLLVDPIRPRAAQTRLAAVVNEIEDHDIELASWKLCVVPTSNWLAASPRSRSHPGAPVAGACSTRTSAWWESAAGARYQRSPSACSTKLLVDGSMAGAGAIAAPRAGQTCLPGAGNQQGPLCGGLAAAQARFLVVGDMGDHPAGTGIGVSHDHCLGVGSAGAQDIFNAGTCGQAHQPSHSQGAVNLEPDEDRTHQSTWLIAHANAPIRPCRGNCG